MLIIIIFIISYLLTNFITVRYTYENGIQFEIKSLQSLRLSSFIESQNINSIHVDQNFTSEYDWNCARIITIVR